MFLDFFEDKRVGFNFARLFLGYGERERESVCDNEERERARERELEKGREKNIVRVCVCHDSVM